MTTFNTDDFETKNIEVFAEEAYLNYAMYVILDRALPFIGDGLKPVQRRIIYAMSELGLQSIAKHKKSARTVGDVLGKYHPHGDSACYEALVIMAQPFSYRYPLIDGQGNFGSIDNPKSFAAMRYTESRLSIYADILLKELGQGTVDWQANFDGSLEEPVHLPSRLPMILLNGATGIAVGMATDLLPHNLGEVAKAVIALIDDPELTLPEIMQYIQGPDFPTGGEIITPKEEITKMYATGNGSVRVRAKYRIEENNIVIYELPYQVSGEKIIMDIANQMQSKKMPYLEDLRDESDHDHPTRIVLIPRSNRVDAEIVMQHLFATTDLEKSFRANFNMIGTNGKPQVKPLISILGEWLTFRRATVVRRLNYRLDKINARLEILAGLLIAYLNLDEVIRIIREEDNPKTVLMQTFKLSVTQADAILDTKLRQLAKLEEMKIRADESELTLEKNKILTTLTSPSAMNKLLKDEVAEAAKVYGDARRSDLVIRKAAVAIDETQLLPVENITVILSKMGWVRVAKGKDIEAENLSYKSGDAFLDKVSGKSNQNIIFFDTLGRTYCTQSSTLPSARTAGEPLTGRFNITQGAQFIHPLIAHDQALYLLAANNGYGFIAEFSEFVNRQKAGKAVVNLSDNAVLLRPILVTDLENTFISVVTHLGRLLIVKANELPQLAKGKGNQLVGIPSAKFKNGEDFVSLLKIHKVQDSLQIMTGKRKILLKPEDWQAFVGERGKKGKELGKGIKIDAVVVIEKEPLAPIEAQDKQDIKLD